MEVFLYLVAGSMALMQIIACALLMEGMSKAFDEQRFK